MTRTFYITMLSLLLIPVQTLLTANIITIFSPGYSEEKPLSAQQAARLCRNNIIQKPLLACFYNDTYLNANFGQEGDIAPLFEQCKNCSAEGIRIILAGISRGASTLFTMMHSKPLDNIAAIVAESPYASFNDVVAQQTGIELNYLAIARAKLRYPAYNPAGPHPINPVSNNLIAIPILLVCSKKDNIVPYTSTVRLAKKLKEQGCRHVYLLIFSEGEHGFLSYKEEFQQVANAFYMRYALPFNPTLAQEGIAKLDHYKL